MLCWYCLLSYLFSPLLFFRFVLFLFSSLSSHSSSAGSDSPLDITPATAPRGSRPPPPTPRQISKQYFRRTWAQNISPYWFDVYERLMKTFVRVESNDSLYKRFVSLVEMWWWNYDRRICEEEQEIPFIRIASLDQPSTGKLQFGLCHTLALEKIQISKYALRKLRGSRELTE